MSGLQPASAPASVTINANASAAPAAVALEGRKRNVAGPVVAILVVVGFFALLVGGYLFIALGAEVIAIGGIMATIPLAIVLLGIRWIDRWEPEPRPLLFLAFFWGAAGAVFIALLAGLIIEGILTSQGVSSAEQDFLGTVFQAPIVEETAKGIGILLIFIFGRRYFDGPVDGVVYGATIAAGFAFTENILYFGNELMNSGGVDGAVVGIFVVRGLMSPFAHVMFTSCTGLAIGLVARRRGGLGVFVAFILGLVPAMLLHALWNGASYIVGDNFLLYYVIVQVPLFVGGIILVSRLRKQETKVTATRLGEYAAAGWFNADEIPALATPRGRRQALAWARQHGLHAVMRGYITDSTKLAFVRQRLVSGQAVDGAQVEEQALLASILTRRAALQPVTATS